MPRLPFAVSIVVLATAIGWQLSGSEAEGEPRLIPASQLVKTWWQDDLYGDSGRAALALYSIYDELALVLPAAVNVELTNKKDAVKIGSALRLAERFRVPEAIPAMLSRLRVQPPMNIALGSGSEVETYPYAMCLATIGRDSVPHIIHHLAHSRRSVEAVDEDEIRLLAEVFRVIYGANHRREGTAILREYSAAPNVQRLLDAYKRLDRREKSSP